MRDILLLGAGKIGAIITEMLSTSGDYRVWVGDRDAAQLTRVPPRDTVQTLELDVTDGAALRAAMAGRWAVISAGPFHITRHVAEAAKAAGLHYFDLTEDVATTAMVKQLAREAGSAFMPQCGLAPGFIGIAAYDLTRRFEQLDNVHMRVGALPRYPTNGLKYNLTWSTEGLINQYCNFCEAIVEGEPMRVLPLEDLETFSLDGILYEAFNTSGGVGTLCDTLRGKVNNLNYRSVRYPGHRDIMRVLLRDLRLRDRRSLLVEIFNDALPHTCQDVVLIFISVSGTRDGRLEQETYANRIYGRQINGQWWSAIQITTAAGICGVVDLMREGRLPDRGFIRQEDVQFDDFIRNRFGRYYSGSLGGESLSD